MATNQSRNKVQNQQAHIKFLVTTRVLFGRVSRPNSVDRARAGWLEIRARLSRLLLCSLASLLFRSDCFSTKRALFFVFLLCSCLFTSDLFLVAFCCSHDPRPRSSSSRCPKKKLIAITAILIFCDAHAAYNIYCPLICPNTTSIQLTQN